MMKEFKGWLVLDYKTGEMRVGKKKPLNEKPTDIPIELKITVKAPEKPTVRATGTIELSETKVADIAIDQL